MSKEPPKETKEVSWYKNPTILIPSAITIIVAVIGSPALVEFFRKEEKPKDAPPTQAINQSVHIGGNANDNTGVIGNNSGTLNIESNRSTTNK